jgi:hypothetical protein
MIQSLEPTRSVQVYDQNGDFGIPDRQIEGTINREDRVFDLDFHRPHDRETIDHHAGVDLRFDFGQDDPKSFVGGSGHDLAGYLWLSNALEAGITEIEIG